MFEPKLAHENDLGWYKCGFSHLIHRMKVRNHAPYHFLKLNRSSTLHNIRMLLKK
ncbi:MAG: hypothetical protein ACI901_001001, partial [Octadecabacter sp.]